MKKILALILVACMAFSLCACDFAKDLADSTLNIKAQAKTFDFDGISIELTTDFVRMDFISDEYDFIVGTETLTLMGIKVDSEDTALNDVSVKDYAESFRSLMLSSNPTEITLIDDIPTMQYTASEDGDEQTIAVMFYKGSDCFYVLCFGASSDTFKEQYKDICKYAKTVKCE